MPDLTIGKTNVTKLLTEKYKKLGKGWLSLIEVPTKRHMEINSEALRILVNNLGYSCVYVTLTKPYHELDKIFKSKKINSDNLYYIDAISKMYGEDKADSKKCIYTAGPLDIDSLTVAIRQLLLTLQSEKKCVFLDSVTTVLLYNSMPRTLRFSKFLTQTLRNVGVDGVMVSIAKGETTKKLSNELKKLTDEFIVISDGGGVKEK